MKHDLGLVDLDLEVAMERILLASMLNIAHVYKLTLRFTATHGTIFIIILRNIYLFIFHIS